LASQVVSPCRLSPSSSRAYHIPICSLASHIPGVYIPSHRLGSHRPVCNPRFQCNSICTLEGHNVSCTYWGSPSLHRMWLDKQQHTVACCNPSCTPLLRSNLLLSTVFGIVVACISVCMLGRTSSRHTSTCTLECTFPFEDCKSRSLDAAQNLLGKAPSDHHRLYHTCDSSSRCDFSPADLHAHLRWHRTCQQLHRW